ncbi:MAG TPA: VanW family protein, partial [Stellaceae bacterium]|nr:VanW family protein [Stellaceae bacterium]
MTKTPSAAFPAVLGECHTPLWSDGRPEEHAYQLGKVQNLRRAAAAIDGVLVPAGAVFSFWKQIGRASWRRGFVTGRMLQQGCLVPATGGGLCQLSNAIYEAALQAGCEIVERHAHSRR